MRPAELYRRGVLLPKDSLALVRLEAGDIEPATAVEHLPISESLWPRCWALINDINRVCGTDLHDRETGIVELEQLPRMIEHLRTRRYTHAEEGEFAQELAELGRRAVEARMPVFFVL
jgi:DNA-binding transcriptional ArsR family regulator